MTFIVTSAAESFIQFMPWAGGSGSGFRLQANSGGCSGLSADISVKEEPEQEDVLVERNGVKLFLPLENRMLLDGVTVDFVDAASQTGLAFHDPKGTTCSQGTGKTL
jgi:iron-sulfur cluster assembly accessory protein